MIHHGITSFVFHDDGSIMAVPRPVVPGPNENGQASIIDGPGVGSWEMTGERTFAGMFVIQCVDVDGKFKGTMLVYPSGEISEDGITCSGATVVEYRNSGGYVTGNRVDDIVAQRILVAPAPLVEPPTFDRPYRGLQ